MTVATSIPLDQWQTDNINNCCVTSVSLWAHDGTTFKNEVTTDPEYAELRRYLPPAINSNLDDYWVLRKKFADNAGDEFIATILSSPPGKSPWIQELRDALESLQFTHSSHMPSRFPAHVAVADVLESTTNIDLSLPDTGGSHWDASGGKVFLMKGTSGNLNRIALKMFFQHLDSTGKPGSKGVVAAYWCWP